MKSSLLRLGAAVLLGFALVGCSGDKGDTGATGPQGPAGPPGPPGASASDAIVLNAGTSTDTYANLQIVAKVTSVSIASAPVVKFSLSDPSGKPIVGFGSTSKSSTATVASYPNLNFSLAKLVPGQTNIIGGKTTSTPNKWVSYIVTTVPTTTTASAPTRPSTDNTGTLVDNGDGTYQYTFYRDVTQTKALVDAMTVSAPNNKADLGDLTYDASLTHRLTIQISGNVPGTGTNTPNAVQVVPGVPMKNPVNVIYDFVPATGQAVAASAREIAETDSCNACHSKLGGLVGDSASSSGAAFHGSARNDVRYCVVCHTDQRKYGRTEAAIDSTLTFTSTSTYRVDDRAVGDLPNLVHKAHLGDMLAKKNYNFGGVLFNEVGYPQDIRNCQNCHSSSGTNATPQGDNWMNVPSRLACGACHDGINFATGTGVTLADAAAGLTSSPQGHVGGAYTDDTACAVCHTPDKVAVYHVPVTPPNPANSLLLGQTNSNTNAAWIASNTDRLPAGAIKVTYDIKSVSVNSSRQPVMVFRLLQNGARADLNNFAATTANPATGQKEIWDGFMGAPSVYFVWAVPQDGVSAPADFNASASVYLRSLWNGTAAGSLTGPDADGYYTAALSATVPTNAVMVTGGLGYTYNVRTQLPLTQTNLPAYPTAAATATGLTAGMPNTTGGLIVIAKNVQKVATGYTGRRAIVDDNKCSSCHQELGPFTEEAFHAGQRNDGTTCSWCHNPNRASSGWSADSTAFVHAIHGAAKRSVNYNWHAVSADDGFWNVKYPGVLARCEQCHLPNTYNYGTLSQATKDSRLYRLTASGALSASISLSPYVVAGTDYGTAGAGTNLVTSPTSTVCFACHDDSSAQAHMSQMGGSIYTTRTAALSTPETCDVCHGAGKIADIKAMHDR